MTLKRLTHNMLRPRFSRVSAFALVAATAVAVLPPVAFAQTTRPATQPAATPKDALKQLNVAMRDGDRERIRSLMDSRTPLESSMVDAMASMAEALAGLQRAASKAFGPEGAKDVTGDDGAHWADGLAKIDSAEVNLNGDVATVVYRSPAAQTQPSPPPAPADPKAIPATNPPPPAGERSEPVSLRRVGGEWKLPVSQLSAGADRTALEQRLAELAVQTKLVREVTEEITAGKYDTAEKAADAWHSRFMQSLGPKPATRPAGK